MCAFIREPVPLFGGQIPSPVAYFDVSFQQCGVGERFRKLIAHAGFLLRACGYVLIGSIGEGRTLAFGLAREVGDVGCLELDFGFLLLGCVGGWAVSREAVNEVLLVLLIDLGGKGLERGEYVVAYRERLLSGWSEGSRESDAVELGGTVSIFQRLPVDQGAESLPVGIIFDSLTLKCRCLRILLIPHF